MSRGRSDAPVRAVRTDVSPSQRARLDEKAEKAREAYWSDPEESRRRHRDASARRTPEQLEHDRQYQRDHYAAHRDRIVAQRNAKKTSERCEAIRTYGPGCLVCGETSIPALFLRAGPSAPEVPAVPEGMTITVATAAVVARLKAQGWPKGVLEVICSRCSQRQAMAKKYGRTPVTSEQETRERAQALIKERQDERVKLRAEALVAYAHTHTCPNPSHHLLMVVPGKAEPTLNWLREQKAAGWPKDGPITVRCSRCRVLKPYQKRAH